MSLTTLRNVEATSVVELPSGAIFLFDGNKAIQVSTDDGANWNPVPGSTGLVCRTDSLVANSLGEVVFGTIATPPKIYYATATSCTQATGTLTNATGSINRVSADVAGSMWAVADNNTRIYHSTDHGHSWSTVTTNYADIGHVYAIAETTYGVVVGGEIGSSYISSDGGATWVDWGLPHATSADPALYHGNLWNIQQSPYTGSLFAAIGEPYPPSPSRSSCQVHRNADGVGVWHGGNGMSNAGANNVASIIFASNGDVMISSIYSQGPTGEVYRSTDDGANWTEISASLGMTFAGTARIHIGPSGRLYVADHFGLYRQGAPVSSSVNPMFFGGGV